MELSPKIGPNDRITIMNKVEDDDDIIEGGDVGGSGSGEKSNVEADNNKTS